VHFPPYPGFLKPFIHNITQMSYVVATSTITDFANNLFTGTLDLVFNMVTTLWPYILTVVLVFAVIGIVKRLMGAAH